MSALEGEIIKLQITSDCLGIRASDSLIDWWLIDWSTSTTIGLNTPNHTVLRSQERVENLLGNTYNCNCRKRAYHTYKTHTVRQHVTLGFKYIQDTPGTSVAPTWRVHPYILPHQLAWNRLVWHFFFFSDEGTKTARHSLRMALARNTSSATKPHTSILRLYFLLFSARAI